MISSETKVILQQYADGNLSNGDLAEWLVQAEYDSSVPQEERDALGQLRLVVVEEAEGRRDTDEILNTVAEMLAAESPEQTLVVRRTGSATEWPQTPSVTTGATSPAQHAGI